MRRRDREINIFNIAFLDVITGAMGAFILLVLLLAPYYTGPNPPPPAMKKVQRAINQAARQSQKLEKQIERAVRNGVDPKLLEKLEKLLKKLKAELVTAQQQLIRLRSEVNHLKSQQQELKNKITRLEKQIRHLQREIQYLEDHQGTAKFRPMVVFVERRHIPNGRFNRGAPFLIYAQTTYRQGVTFSVGSGAKSHPVQSDPPFRPQNIPDDRFNLSRWTSTHVGEPPFPRGKGPQDEQFFTPHVDNGPGYNPESPNTEELVIADANLRATINLYVLLTPAFFKRPETHGVFTMTLTFGRQAITNTFRLSFGTPIFGCHISVLPGENMRLGYFRPNGSPMERRWSVFLTSATRSRAGK